MLEAYAQMEDKRHGMLHTRLAFEQPINWQVLIVGKQRSLEVPPKSSAIPEELIKLKQIIDSPPDVRNEYTRIKKDIFHAFHMLPIPVNHGVRPAFLRALRDHILRWDPFSRAQVDEVCRRHFNLSFDQMLARKPRFIAERTPRHVPSPSVLVPAIQHVYNMFRHATDAKTGVPLFTPAFIAKAEAVLELARQGHLSDVPDIPMYEHAGIDKYGLQKWKCVRGTNKVEGGPHGDIYRKFGALHGKLLHLDTSLISSQSSAGPRLTTNCLTDHRTWYNLQVLNSLF